MGSWSRSLSENVKRYLAAGTSFTARLRESPSAFVPRYFDIDFRWGLHGLFRRELWKSTGNWIAFVAGVSESESSFLSLSPPLY